VRATGGWVLGLADGVLLSCKVGFDRALAALPRTYPPTRHPPRGHIGGMAGGALVAWAVGPRLVRDEASGRLLDSPPLPWLAMPAPPSGLRNALGKQAEAEDGGRGRRKKKRGEEGDPLPDRPGAGPRP
jgi:hypothetical protein